MKGCKRSDVLLTDSGICIDNVKATFVALSDNQKLLLIFIAALFVMFVCSVIASGRSHDANMDNKMQQISNSIDRRK